MAPFWKSEGISVIGAEQEDSGVKPTTVFKGQGEGGS
jgi:hypothetical protein